MKINENIVKGKWLELRGEVRKAWGKLTDDELDKTKGDMQAIAGLIQQKYGESQESQTEKLSRIFKRFDDQKETTVEQLKKTLKN